MLQTCLEKQRCPVPAWLFQSGFGNSNRLKLRASMLCCKSSRARRKRRSRHGRPQPAAPPLRVTVRSSAHWKDVRVALPSCLRIAAHSLKTRPCGLMDLGRGQVVDHNGYERCAPSSLLLVKAFSVMCFQGIATLDARLADALSKLLWRWKKTPGTDHLTSLVALQSCRLLCYPSQVLV